MSETDLTRPTLSSPDSARMLEVERLALRGRAAVDPLVALLEDPSWAVRRAVSAALARLGDAALGALCRRLRDQRTSEAGIAATVDTLAESAGNADHFLLLLADLRPPPPILCDIAQILGRRRSATAIPKLRELATHSDDNVAVAAIEALGRIGGAVGVDTLIAITAEGNFFRTFPAIAVLGKSGDSAVVEPLLALLHSPLFAMEAARALGYTGDARAVPPLVQFLEGDDDLVRTAAVALAQLRERAGLERLIDEALALPASTRVERLIATLPGADIDERIALCTLLSATHDQRAIAPLLAHLDDPALAEISLAGLRRFGGASVLDAPVAAALREGSSAQRRLLLPLVSGRSNGVAEVVACLRDPDPTVRIAACDLLARTGNSAVVSDLFALLADEDSGVAQSAIAAIQSLGSAQTEELTLTATDSPTKSVRRAALRMVGYFGYASGLPALLKAVDDPDEQLREAALTGLPYLDDARAMHALLTATGHASAKTRASAMRALGHAAWSSAVSDALLRGVTDGDTWVRYYACQSLGKLQAQDAVAAMLRLLDDPAGQVRVAAIEALSRLGTDAAIAALQELTASTDPDARRAAVLGLGLGHRADSLPFVLTAARSEDGATRLIALSALTEFDSPEVLEAWRTATRDLDDGVRTAAIGFLAARPGSEAAEALIDLLPAGSPSALLPGGSPSALLPGGSPSALLIEALSRPVAGRVAAVIRAARAAESELARTLVGVLARIDTQEAQLGLIDLLTSGSRDARRSAAAALAGQRAAIAHTALERAATADPDPEVRRIALLALSGLSG